MNLPSNITDIFMTLRFVTKSVVKNLTGIILIIARGYENHFLKINSLVIGKFWVLVLQY